MKNLAKDPFGRFTIKRVLELPRAKIISCQIQDQILLNFEELISRAVYDYADPGSQAIENLVDNYPEYTPAVSKLLMDYEEKKPGTEWFI